MGMLLFPISACSQPVVKNNATSLTIGILNEFPDSAKYIKQKTFVFRHQVETFEKDRFKKIITLHILAIGKNKTVKMDSVKLNSGKNSLFLIKITELIPIIKNKNIKGE